MRKTLLISLFMGSAVFAAHPYKMFSASQYDSLFALIPGGDSLRKSTTIVGIMRDTLNNDIILISLDAQDNPVKATIPNSSLKKAPAMIPSTAVANPAKRQKLEQNGRTWFIIESTIKSAAIYPMSYNAILVNDSGSNAQISVGLSLLTWGGMLYGTFAFTKNMELGYGKTALMNYGSTALGGYYPFLLASFFRNTTLIDARFKYRDTNFFGTDREINEGYISQSPTSLIRAWSSIIGFPLGIYLGSRERLIEKNDYGRAALMQYFSQTFGALAFALPVFLFDHPDNEEQRDYLTASTGLSMAMLPVGFYTGYEILKNTPISSGRGTMPWVTGSMGALTAMGLVLLSDEDNGIAGVRTLLATGIAGYGAGTWLGLSYHPSLDYSYLQSVFIGASSVCGAGIIEAFPLLANTQKRQPYIISGIIGAWTGFFIGERLSFQLFEKSGRDKHSSNVRLNLPGLAALPYYLSSGKKPPTLYSGRPCETALSLPVANLEWRF